MLIRYAGIDKVFVDGGAVDQAIRPRGRGDGMPAGWGRWATAALHSHVLLAHDDLQMVFDGVSNVFDPDCHARCNTSADATAVTNCGRTLTEHVPLEESPGDGVGYANLKRDKVAQQVCMLLSHFLARKA